MENRIDSSMAASLIVTALALIAMVIDPGGVWGSLGILALIAIGGITLKIANNDDGNKNLSGGVNLGIAFIIFAWLSFGNNGATHLKQQIIGLEAVIEVQEKIIVHQNAFVPVDKQLKVTGKLIQSVIQKNTSEDVIGRYQYNVESSDDDQNFTLDEE